MEHLENKVKVLTLFSKPRFFVLLQYLNVQERCHQPIGLTPITALCVSSRMI